MGADSQKKALLGWVDAGRLRLPGNHELRVLEASVLDYSRRHLPAPITSAAIPAYMHVRCCHASASLVAVDARSRRLACTKPTGACHRVNPIASHILKSPLHT